MNLNSRPYYFFGFFLALLFFQTAYGASDGAPAEVHEIASRIKETREVIVESEAERRKLLGSLYAINQRVKKIAADKGILTDELLQSQDSVNTVASAIVSLEQQISRQRTGLNKRLRALYKLSGESLVGIVFSQSNAYEFDSTLRNLRIVSDNDHQMIIAYRQNLKSLARQRKKLKTQVEKLLLVERRIKRQELLLVQEHKAKSSLAQSIESATKDKMLEIQKLRTRISLKTSIGSSQNSADQEIAYLLKPSIFEKKGQLGSPVLGRGRVVRDFGLYVDPEYKFKMSHKGWRIAVQGQTVVSAVDEGTVVFSGSVSGYGSTVILDHRDHYYSVYSGLSGAPLSVGSAVTKGGTLGLVSDLLYFEFRHFSEPENPSHWISSQSKQVAVVNSKQGVPE